MRKSSAALLSIFSNTTLIIIKIGAYLLTGSISVLSEAVHSGMDLFAAIIAFYSVRKAESPADREHPYGHGKYENLSGLIEGALIILAALLILYEAFKKAIEGFQIQLPEIAMATMAISAIVNLIISSMLMRIAKKTDSLALEADARHLRVDVYSSAGVFVGLLIISLTGYHVLDSVFAGLITIIIFYEGYIITRKSIEGLLDSSLPPDELELIKEAIDKYSDRIKDFHSLRTRKSGSERHIDLHITVCRDEKIVFTHETMDEIERELKKRLPNVKIIIHPEPCTHYSDKCPADCYWEDLKKKLKNQ
ncbi:MAG: cation transporter [Nitrospirae bacterium]|nr:cation transporter [Nitrospirota bacterium]